MEIKKVSRYFCEFCRRGSLKKSTMTKHESGCTANPNRVCGLCVYGGLKQQSMADLIAHVELGMDELKRFADGCPGCILAAIRQSKVNDDPESNMWYDFKTELQAFWQQAAEDKQAQQDAHDIHF